MGKKTTTLTLDSETVEKAKKMNINISELTETVLKGFTFEPSDLDEEAINQKYRELFNAIRPILKHQKIGISVGDYFIWNPTYEEYETIDCVVLCSDGTFWIEVHEFETADIVGNKSVRFYSPKEILSNLIKGIEEHKEHLKEEIKEIEMVKRIVEALYPSFAKK